jgi:hypothetical protein
MVNNSTNINKTNNLAVRFIDIGKIVDHHCLDVIVNFVDIG